MATNFRHLFAGRRVVGPALEFVSRVATLSEQARETKEYGQAQMPLLQATVEESAVAFASRLTDDHTVRSTMVQLVLAAELLGPRHHAEDALSDEDRSHPALAGVIESCSLARNIFMLKSAQRRAYEKHSRAKLFVAPDTDGEDCLCVQVFGQGGELYRLFKLHVPGKLLPKSFARTFLQAGLLVAAGVPTSDLPDNLHFRGALEDWARLFNLFEGDCGKVEFRQVGEHMAHADAVERLGLSGAAAVFVAKESFGQAKERCTEREIEEAVQAWAKRIFAGFDADEQAVGDLPSVKFRCFLVAEEAGATLRSGLGSGSQALAVALRECHHPWFNNLIETAGQGEPDQDVMARAVYQVFSKFRGALVCQPSREGCALDLWLDGATRWLECVPGGPTLPGGFFLTFVEAGLLQAAGYTAGADLPAKGLVFRGELEAWSRVYNLFQVMVSRGEVP